MAGGRPTSYKPEMIELAYDYLNDRKDFYDEETKRYKVNLPTIEGFAKFIGVNKTTLYEWSQKHEEFSNALSDIKSEQAQRLQDNGLAGTYNPTIAKLILSANHNMRERQDVTTDDKELPQPLLYALRNNNSDEEDSEAG